MARVVVIGGGINGVLTARELLLAGHQVTLAEAEHVGAGSSSRTAAGIRQQFSTEGTVRAMRYAVGFYRDFGTEAGESPIVQNGYLFLHDDAERWARALEVVDLQHAAGLSEVEVVPQTDLAARFPWLEPSELLGGTWCPTDGFLLPHVVYNEGARRVRELGGTVLQRAPVTGATSEGGRLTGVITPKGTLEADYFVDCTNCWTKRLAALLDGEDLPVAPYKRYLWFLKRDGPLSAQSLAGMPLTVFPDGTYTKPENADVLQMGHKHDAEAEWAFTYDDQDRIDPGFGHTGDLDALPFELWARISEWVPPLAEFAGIQSTTSGFYGTTPDHNPFLGFDRQRPNLVRLVGFSGHGAMMAPFNAKVAAALVQAGHDLDTVDVNGVPVDLTCFQLGRAFAHAEEMVI